MYTYRENKPVKEITRDSFVKGVFELGYSYNHGVDSMITAVQLGDIWVNKCQGDYLDDSFLQCIYSEELIYATTVISGKMNNERYSLSKKALVDSNNYETKRLEIKICEKLGFQIPYHSFITQWTTFLFDDSLRTKYYLGREFNILCQDICLNPKLLNMNPATLLLGVKILLKRNKLKARNTIRLIKFVETMELISAECDVPVKDVLNKVRSIRENLNKVC